MFSDFFHALGDLMDDAAQAAPKARPAIARWTEPEAPQPRYQPAAVGAGARAGRPEGPPPEWVMPGRETRLGPHTEQKIIDGRTYIKNPEYENREARLSPGYLEDKDRYDRRVQRLNDLGLGDELGMKAGALTTVDLPKHHELTREEYEALNPSQRAAIDFNTSLTQAVKRDLKMQDKYDPSKQERKTYDSLVHSVFGDDRGSDTDVYAPETMAVLQQLKLKDKPGDLDDYLGLKVVITDKDLKHLHNLDAADKGMEGVLGEEGFNLFGGAKHQSGRAVFQQGIVNKVQDLQKTIAQGNQLLQSWKATSRAARGSYVQTLGGTPGEPHRAVGFGPGTEGSNDQYFQIAYNALVQAKDKSATDQILNAIHADQGAGKFDDFMSYVDTRTRNSELYNAPLAEIPEAKGKDPAEFRKLLGLDR